MKLLHIVSTPRATSNTVQIASAFLESMQEKYADLVVEEVNLFQQDLPAVAGDNIDTKYSLMIGQPIDRSHEKSWKQIERLIEHFLSADIYVITTPMWNFSIPYALKYYIDCIVQPGYLFHFNEEGRAVGLASDKKMICITSRGSDYSEKSPFHAYDFQEPYLRSIFGFVGIHDIHFINAQPMDISAELREIAMAAAIEEARQITATYDWHLTDDGQDLTNPSTLKPKPIR